MKFRLKITTALLLLFTIQQSHARYFDLDDAPQAASLSAGQHNAAVPPRRYFKTAPRHGMFRPENNQNAENEAEVKLSQTAPYPYPPYSPYGGNNYQPPPPPPPSYSGGSYKTTTASPYTSTKKPKTQPFQPYGYQPYGANNYQSPQGPPSAPYYPQPPPPQQPYYSPSSYYTTPAYTTQPYKQPPNYQYPSQTYQYPPNYYQPAPPSPKPEYLSPPAYSAPATPAPTYSYPTQASVDAKLVQEIVGLLQYLLFDISSLNVTAYSSQVSTAAFVSTMTTLINDYVTCSQAVNQAITAEAIIQYVQADTLAAFKNTVVAAAITAIAATWSQYSSQIGPNLGPILASAIVAAYNNNEFLQYKLVNRELKFYQVGFGNSISDAINAVLNPTTTNRPNYQYFP